MTLAWLRGAALALLGGVVLAAGAGELTREDVARRFAPPLQVGEKLAEPPVWPISSELRPDDGPLGYVFESVDIAPIPGFEGTPINLLVAVDNKGTLLDVSLIRQHEPVFLGGLGPGPLLDFLRQYPGVSLASPVTVRSRYGEAGGGDASRVVLDGVTKATASIRIINQTVLTSALTVARARLGFAAARHAGPPASVRTEVFEALDFEELVAVGAIGYLRASNAQVEALYADSEVAGEDPQALDLPEETFVELWFANLNVPSIGRALLGDAGFARLIERLDEGQLAYWVASAGRDALVDQSFVRGTSPPKLTLLQGGVPFELRDLDFEHDATPGAPPFNSRLVLALPPLSGLDPGAPVTLDYSLTRNKGYILPQRIHRKLSTDYVAPARWFERPPPPPPAWLQAWQSRAPELWIIGAALALLAAVLARPRLISLDARRLRAFRLGFLAFTLLFVGWYAQGQLSIVQLTGAIKSLSAGAGLSSFLYDPVSLLLIGASLASFLAWGRGTFCGWLCPFGALQEFAAIATARLGIRARRLPPRLAATLSRGRYAILAALVLAAAYSPRAAEWMVEIEPFKTAITVGFDRAWPFVAYAVVLLALAGVYYKFFCRYLCPLGALLTLGGKLRLANWLPRRAECGSPCQRCRHACAYDAIDRQGGIDYDECFQCLDCVGIYHDTQRCAPLILHRKKAHRPAPGGATGAQRRQAVAAGARG